MYRRGNSGNSGGLCVPWQIPHEGMRLTNESKRREMGCCIERKKKDSINQGIAIERQGQWQEDDTEVGAFHSTEEAGEPECVGSLWREGKANTSHSE